MKNECRFGEKKLFHRYVDPAGDKAVYFSIASASPMGEFNIAEQQATFKGLIFFMYLRDNTVAALELMFVTAGAIALELDGNIYDDKHQLLTESIKDKYRKKISHVKT